MENKFTTRTALILGEDGIKKLQNSHVLVIGVGGVGSFCAEALVRAGVGNITIVDYAKVEVVKERLLDINNNLNINAIKATFNHETSDEIFNNKYDYVADAIDMVSSKIHLVQECIKRNIPIISSMGMGNKLDPTKIEVSDISKTHTCPLAKVIRKELRDRNIEHLKVVFSTEHPLEVKEKITNGHRILPGSILFMSSSGGLTIAAEIVKDILNINL